MRPGGPHARGLLPRGRRDDVRGQELEGDMGSDEAAAAGSGGGREPRGDAGLVVCQGGAGCTEIDRPGDFSSRPGGETPQGREKGTHAPPNSVWPSPLAQPVRSSIRLIAVTLAEPDGAVEANHTSPACAVCARHSASLLGLSMLRKITSQNWWSVALIVVISEDVGQLYVLLE